MLMMTTSNTTSLPVVSLIGKVVVAEEHAAGTSAVELDCCLSAVTNDRTVESLFDELTFDVEAPLHGQDDLRQ